MIRFSKNDEKHFAIQGIIFIVIFLFLISPVTLFIIYKLFALHKLCVTTLIISRSFFWICLALLWFYSVRIEKQKLLIWKDRRYVFSAYIKFILILFGFIYFGLAIIHFLYGFTHLNRTSHRLLEMVNVMRNNKSLILFTTLTAGITEELIFRGYIQTRLGIVFQKPWLSILISALLFGLLHYGYGTVINVIGPFFIGIVFAYFYSEYRNIKLLIVCHCLWDFLAVFLLMNRHP